MDIVDVKDGEFVVAGLVDIPFLVVDLGHKVGLFRQRGCEANSAKEGQSCKDRNHVERRVETRRMAGTGEQFKLKEMRSTPRLPKNPGRRRRLARAHGLGRSRGPA